MDDTGRSWDMEVIDDVFNSRDAELIKRVPLPMNEREDSWFWLLDDKGSFIVKSAYRWLQREFEIENKSFWKKLWSLRLPGKVTQFLWRVCKGCPSTAYALVVKQIVESAQCPWYRNVVETDTHVLFTCEFARTVWYSAGLQQLLQVLPHETIFMILLRVFETCMKEQCVLVGMISWCLWNRRAPLELIQARHFPLLVVRLNPGLTQKRWLQNGGPGRTSARLHITISWQRRPKWSYWILGNHHKYGGSAFGMEAVAMNFLADWKETQIPVGGRGGHNEEGDYVWRKLREGWVKMNTDAAVFSDGSIGLGYDMRNAQEVFLGARCCKKVGAWTTREAEAIGMKEALLWVIARKYDHCIIDTDSQVLVAACNGGPGEAYFDTIIGDCIQLLKHISPVLVKFVYRFTNSVMHELFKAAYSMSDVRDWNDYSPDFIMHVLDKDMF